MEFRSHTVAIDLELVQYTVAPRGTFSGRPRPH